MGKRNDTSRATSRDFLAMGIGSGVAILVSEVTVLIATHGDLNVARWVITIGGMVTSVCLVAAFRRRES